MTLTDRSRTGPKPLTPHSVGRSAANRRASASHTSACTSSGDRSARRWTLQPPRAAKAPTFRLKASSSSSIRSRTFPAARWRSCPTAGGNPEQRPGPARASPWPARWPRAPATPAAAGRRSGWPGSTGRTGRPAPGPRAPAPAPPPCARYTQSRNTSATGPGFSDGSSTSLLASWRRPACPPAPAPPRPRDPVPEAAPPASPPASSCPRPLDPLNVTDSPLNGHLIASSRRHRHDGEG